MCQRRALRRNAGAGGTGGQGAYGVLCRWAGSTLCGVLEWQECTGLRRVEWRAWRAQEGRGHRVQGTEYRLFRVEGTRFRVQGIG